MENIIFLLLALGASLMGAISGIGGGVIIKPVMDATTSLGASVISFLSGITVLCMTSVSLLRGFLKKNTGIAGMTSTLLALGSIAGGFLGKACFSLVVKAMGQAGAGLFQSALLFVIVCGIFVYTFYEDKLHRKNVKNMLATLFAGFSLGAVSAFLGIGGGPMNLALLSYFFGMDTKTSAANSLYIIFFSQVASFVTSAVEGIPAFPVWALIFMAAGGVLGGLLGTKVRTMASESRVKKLYRFTMGLIICVCAYNIVRYSLML